MMFERETGVLKIPFPGVTFSPLTLHELARNRRRNSAMAYQQISDSVSDI